MKRALVISGGGSKGAFAVGILKKLLLLFPQLKFDIIVGTSTGALIAPLAAVGELDLLEEIYTTHSTEQVVTKHRIGDRLNQKSIFTVEPLWQLIRHHMSDARYEQIVQSSTDIFIITTCLQTQGTVVYTTHPSPKSSSLYSVKTMKDAEHMRLSVLGSACQPVFMTPVKIDINHAQGPEKEFQYVDGGVREYAGIQMAIDQGATEIFCILLSTGKSNEDLVEYTSLFPILQRTIAMFSEDVEKNDCFIPQQLEKAQRYINSVKQKMSADGIPQNKIDEYFTIDGSSAFEAKQTVRLFLMRPEEPLGGGPGGLVFDPAEMRSMVETGQGAAQEFVAKLDPREVTWLV